LKSIFVIKDFANRLEATDMEAEKTLDKIKDNEVIKISIKRNINPAQHRKFWSMFGKVFNNQDKYETETDMLTEIKLKAGHYDEHVTLKGVIIYVPKSISFDEMTQDEFNPFYQKAVNICLKHFIGSDDQALIDEIVRY